MGDFLRKHIRGLLCISLSLLSVLLLTFSSGAVALRPAQMGLTVVSTFQQAIHAVGSFFSNTVTAISELGELQERYQVLQDRVVEYEQLQGDIVQLEAELEDLRRVLGFQQRLEYETVPAEVVAKAPGNAFSSLVISRGSLAGIRDGMPVIAIQDGRRGLVGKTHRVGLNSSVVIPLQSADMYVAARLANLRFEGLVQGGGFGAGELSMRYVNEQARDAIAYGDTVITSGMGSRYPRGIEIGSVTGIQVRSYQTTLELRVEPLIDFTRIEHVYVVLSDLSEAF